MEETWLGSIMCQKGFGIIVDHKMTVKQQCDIASERDNPSWERERNSETEKERDFIVVNDQHIAR